jgi:arginase family enzyme
VETILEQDRRFIVSIDIDHLDATYAPATGTPLMKDESGKHNRVNRFGETPPGVSLEQSRRAFYKIMQHSKVVAADLSEPGYAVGDDTTLQSDNLQTMKTTLTLLASMLGFGTNWIKWVWYRTHRKLALQVNDLLRAS